MVVMLVCQKSIFLKLQFNCIYNLFVGVSQAAVLICCLYGGAGGKTREREGEGGEVLSWVLSPLTMEGQ